MDESQIVEGLIKDKQRFMPVIFDTSEQSPTKMERQKINKKSLLNASEISSEQDIDFKYKSSQYMDKEVEQIKVNERA